MSSQGQCREDDTTLVINEETHVQIEDVSMQRVPECRSGVGTTLDEHDMEFEGSFTVEFEDKADAIEFWQWLENGT
jgi:hypothetical protein